MTWGRGMIAHCCWHMLKGLYPNPLFLFGIVNLLAGIASLTMSRRFLKSLREITFQCYLELARDLEKIILLFGTENSFYSLSRLYEKFGETALRPLIKFHPSVLPSDIKQLCRNDPAHFLAYLDSLVKSKPEDKR